MRWRYLVNMVLIIAVVVGVLLIASTLVRRLQPDQLQARCTGLQIIVFVVTAAGGILAVFRYWESVESRIEQQKWEKLRYLENSFNIFRDKHVKVIQAFEYPHILEAEYLPLCEKALLYDAASDSEKPHIMTTVGMSQLRDLDDFLEYFENVYFAVVHRLINLKDFFLFMRYYVELLDNALKDPDGSRLQRYIDAYYYNIPLLLNLCRREFETFRSLK